MTLIDEKTIKKRDLEFDAAPPYKKKIALRLYATCKAFDEFKKKPIKGNKAEVFCRLFNLRKISSIDAEDYRRMKKTLIPRTLFKWYKLYREGGIDALVPKTGRPGRRAHTKDATNKIRGMLFLHPRAEVSWIHRQLGILGIRISLSSVYRIIRDEQKKNPQFHAWLDDPNLYKGKFAPAFGDADGNIGHINQLWEADASRTVNVLIDGRIYFFYVVIDIFSRRAMVLITDRPRASALAALINMAIDAWGKPEMIRCDFGRDFRAKEIIIGLERLGIKIASMLPYCPEMKGIVERFIGRFKRQFLQYQPGFIGQDAKEAAAIRARRKEIKGKIFDIKLSPQDLQERSNKWCLNDYEQTPHRGLGGELPAVKAAQSTVPAQYISDPRATKFLLCPTGTRKFTREGIYYKGGKYFSPELADLIGQEVEVREDLQNASLLYVFAGSPKKFRGIAIDERLANYSPEELTNIKKEQKARNRAEARAWEAYAKDYIREKEARPEKSRATVRPLIHRIKFDSDNIQEGSKCANEREKILQNIDGNMLQADDAEMPDGEGLFYGLDSELRDYGSIREKLRQGKPITDREQRVKEDVENNPRLFELLKIAEGGRK